MARQRHLRNAPISEALIDLRVILPPNFEPKKFANLSGALSNQYPKKEPRRIITGSFGIEEGKPFIKAPEDKGVQGWVYKSNDEKNIAQFRVDGFTFNRLQPYTDWTDVLSKAKQLWESYDSIATPELITRIATRYINRLDLKLPIIDFKEYLTAPPQIPSSLPQKVSQFLTKVVIHEEDITAIIIQTLDKSPNPERARVILDIDVFKINKIGFNKNNIWSEFDRLRVLKDRIFFDSITEKTARLYE